MADAWKFQYSQSDGNGGILVARTDESELLEKMINQVNALMGKGNVEVTKPVIAQTPTESIVKTNTESKTFCNKHQKEMKFREYGRTTWYDHRRKNGEEWEQCKGFGFPSELRESIEESFQASSASY